MLRFFGVFFSPWSSCLGGCQEINEPKGQGSCDGIDGQGSCDDMDGKGTCEAIHGKGSCDGIDGQG